MVKVIQKQELDLTLKFGGGLNTRASEDEINPREAADGKNFVLDLKNKELRTRMPFDLVGTVPNALQIRGGGSLLESDGTVTTLFQAGGTVYSWDGASTFTSVGSVNSSAKLRGHWRSHVWNLSDELILTDLNLVEVVKKWNGTALSSVSFTDETGSGFGNFYAKYLSVSDERAIFGHIKDPGATTKHLVVGSERSNYTVITVNNRPSTSISEADPFFLLAPDLKPINGMVNAFGTTILSTERGQIFNLSGQSAQDFSFQSFYPGSAASGDESLSYIGNDIIFGRQGRIESVRDTDRFGDAENDDLTVDISDLVEDYNGWHIVYNSRLNRVYCFPVGVSEVWVFQTSMQNGELSKWMKWETSHPLGFNPTFAMSMLDPSDGLEYVFMGDSSGNIYRMEGEGDSGDGGTTQIETQWLSRLFSAPLDAQVYNIEGYVKYRKSSAVSLEISFEYAGESIFNENLIIDLPAEESGSYFGGDAFFGGDFYFGATSGKLTKRKFFAQGQADDFQIRVKMNSNAPVVINEIGLRFNASGS